MIASEDQTAETLDCMKEVSSSIPSTVAISAMDGKTLAESGKMLLFYLTEVANTGMELSGDRVTLKNHFPFLDLPFFTCKGRGWD